MHVWLNDCEGIASSLLLCRCCCFSYLFGGKISEKFTADPPFQCPVSHRMDWRRPANLDAAFAASASATGLDSVPFAAMFRYEVDPTCAGVLGTGSTRISAGTRHRPESSGMGAVRAQSTAIDATSPRAVRSSSSRSSSPEELYSPTALSFVSPVLEVKWPVGVLLQTGVLHTYGRIHRSLFQHQLALHRLRRLRVALRELDACVDASRGGGGGGSGARGRRSALGGGVEGGTRRQPGAGVSWDRGRIHWLHLFRHEMQHMADSLQVSKPSQHDTTHGHVVV